MCDVHYCAYYLLGVTQVTGGHPTMSAAPFFDSMGRVQLQYHSAALQVGTRRIFIDTGDSHQLCDDMVDWSDVYGKVNADREQYTPSQRRKVVPIGPSFGIRAWSAWETLTRMGCNYLANRKQLFATRDFIASYWRQYRHTLPLQCYAPSPPPSVPPNYIFFAATLWRNETRTNECRLNFIKACKQLPWLHFEGGFAPRYDGAILCPPEHLMTARCPLLQYVAKTKQSMVAFNTPAVMGCHGWKLGEFLAMGKAIISTPIFRDLPAPLVHGEQIYIVDGSVNSIIDALNHLHHDPGYRQKLEKGARRYFDTYLSPRRVMERLIDQPRDSMISANTTNITNAQLSAF